MAEPPVPAQTVNPANCLERRLWRAYKRRRMWLTATLGKLSDLVQLASVRTQPMFRAVTMRAHTVLEGNCRVEHDEKGRWTQGPTERPSQACAHLRRRVELHQGWRKGDRGRDILKFLGLGDQLSMEKNDNFWLFHILLVTKLFFIFLSFSLFPKKRIPPHF